MKNVHIVNNYTGKKLYDYARNGEQVEIPIRNIKIYNLQLKDINEENLCLSIGNLFDSYYM